MDRVHRRDFLIAAGALLAAPLAAKAQQAAKVARIGWLGDISAAGPRLEAFFQGLHDLGREVLRPDLAVAGVAGDPED